MCYLTVRRRSSMYLNDIDVLLVLRLLIVRIDLFVLEVLFFCFVFLLRRRRNCAKVKYFTYLHLDFHFTLLVWLHHRKQGILCDAWMLTFIWLLCFMFTFWDFDGGFFVVGYITEAVGLSFTTLLFYFWFSRLVLVFLKMKLSESYFLADFFSEAVSLFIVRETNLSMIERYFLLKSMMLLISASF